MKKLLLLLSIVTAFAVGGSALVSTASAASCTPFAQPIYWDGYFAYRAQLNACTGVSGVEFSGSNQGGGLGDTGIWVSSGPYHGWHDTPFAGADVYLTQPSYGTTIHVPFFGAGCNGTTMPSNTAFNYRIRNSFGNTWGSWHRYVNPTLEYIC